MEDLDGLILLQEKMVDYWKGVLLVPERLLIVGKIDNVICGSIQLIKPVQVMKLVSLM